MARLFIWRGKTGTLVSDVVVKDVATKILRDGQLFILRGDKTYTLQGQQVE